METITLRPMQGCDFDSAVRLWNETRPCDPITARVFRRKVILDVNFDPHGYQIAFSPQRAEGFIYVVRRLQPLDNDGDLMSDRAWISGFGIREDAPAGTAEALLRAGEAFAADCGAKRLGTFYTPYYFTQGFDLDREARYITLFRQEGYADIRESYAREIDLFSYRVPDELRRAKVLAEQQGFCFSTLSDATLLPFWDFMNRYQPAGWRVRIRQLLRDSDDYDRVHIVIRDGEVVGFNVFGDPDGSPERFGPFGVREAFRGRKLGQILLSECLSEMKRRGLHCAWMQSTGKGSAADRVYEKAGFRIIRRHMQMEREL